jgi:uncharacterized protein YcfL
MTVPNALKLVVSCLCLGGILGIGGCKADTSPIGGQYDEVSRYPNITLSQGTLQEALGFQEPIVSRTADNFMHVSLPVRARSNEELLIEYRVIWLDASLQPLRPETAWVPLRLEPRQPYNITVQSTTPLATNYNLQFRWSRP